ELLGRVRETALGAYAHQEVPFERLVDELDVERSLGHTPLFQVLFTLQTEDGRGDGPPSPGGPRMEQLATASGTAKFDLDLGMVDDGGLLFGRLEYRAGLFEPATVERMLGHLRVLLGEMASGPERRLSELELLPAAERRLVVEEWNATAAAVPAGAVYELFEAQAARTPDAAALVSRAGETLTYAELDARANRLARHLRGLGVAPDVRVGICLERGVEMVVSTLAVLKAGGAYVPLDPAYPAERLAYMLEDSAAAVLLTDSRLAGQLPPHGAEAVLLDRVADEIGRQPAEPPRVEVHPENLGYVIYTSGSTGRPKGVALPQAALVNLVEWLRGALPGGARTLQFASLSFDVHFEDMFSAWSTGGAVFLITEDEQKDAVALARVLESAGIEQAMFPVVMLQQAAEEAEARGQSLPSLREVMVAGEQLHVTPAVVRLFQALPGRRLHNHYGPSETHVVTAHTLAGDPASWPSHPPIGRPISNTRIYLLDAALKPVPIGVPGELYIGGVALARGYLNRPALTAERFVPDPLAAAPGARLYRTGDLARWRVDGEIEYLGRADHQVKIRGFRVEPGEVESLLGRHPGVREVVVTAREDRPGEKRLVAYLVPSADAPPSAGELRGWLRERVPEYLVPSAFVALEALPLTPTRKVDRRALPAPEAHEEEARAYVAPRTAAEEVLAEIWSAVLGVERVGVEDNFFELGGHSLSATRMVSRVRGAFGVELPLRAVFEAQTVRALAARVEALRSGGAALDAPPVVPVPRDGELPLSFAQQRLWFIDQLEPGSAAYNLSVALRLGGGVDAAGLAWAFTEVARRHEVLRTTFGMGADGEPVQVIHAPAPVRLPVVDLSAVDAAERESVVARLANEEAARPFDLARGPVLRCTLLRLGDADSVLLFTMHHIASDGWSMEILQREVTALYGAYLRGEDARLPDLPVQYADYAVWQRRWLEGEVLDRQVAYWRRRLAGAPAVLELPVDRPRPAVADARGASRGFALSPELSRALRELGRREGATLYMTLLAAWQALLGRYGGQADVVVGTPVAGRTRLETEGLIGFFVNTLVVRTRLEGDPTFREVLARVREGVLEAQAHQDVPFERLVDELDVERSLSHTPLFQVLFTFAQQTLGEGGGPRLGEADAAPPPSDSGTVKFDLTLGMSDLGEQVAGALAYRAELFDAATAERMTGHLVRLLERAAADPDARLSEIDLLDEAGRARVVEEWNATRRDLGADVCLHALFAAQAARTPAAVALVFAGGRLTYAELDARANQLAHHLRRHGVGPEVRVGVCAERSPELVIALLGVLKAGGAYVPVDPANPAERLAYMLEDSGVPVVLTLDRHLDRLPPLAARTLRLDTDWGEVAGEPESAPEVGVTPDHLAYVIYTSGSTGRPKGAMNAHHGIVNRLRWGQEEYGLGADDAVLQKTPVTFDVSGWELFWPLIVGARLVLARPEGHRDPAYLTEVIEREGVTVVHFVPPMLRAFLEAGDPARCGSVRRVFCSGEALGRDLVERTMEAFPGVELHNLYGPTEAAIEVTYHACARGGGAVPIGRPVANTRMYVLDPAGRPQPQGVPGELFIGGVQVGRGYLGRPALTAGTFVPDPYSPGARLYRTGDRARWLSTGELEYLGRIDFQVKVRGFRIELGEIESVLLEHPAVRAAVAVAREDGTGEKWLAAYVVADAWPGAQALRAHLAARLPEYMVPGAIVPLDALPLSPNGKVDRRALPAPTREAARAGSYAAPRTTAEEVLAEIWSELLGLERAGVEDNFFALGGHSLVATRMVSRVRQAFGVELPLRAVFEAQTVRALAGRVEALRSGGATPEAPPVVPVPRGGELPLSFAQQRLWFIDRLEPGSAAYNLPVALRLRGGLDAAGLAWALTEVVRRHEVLRTTFGAGADGEAVQVVHAPAPVRLPVVDLSGVGAAEREALVERLENEEAARPFDLARGPVLRCTLLRLGDAESVVLFTMHHIASDGWSMEILQREVTALYDAYLRGEDARLPDLPVQYADYAVWQRRWLEGEVLDRQVAYWRRRLDGAPAVLELPADRPRPAVASRRGASHGFALSPELSQGLRELSRREGATLFMTLLAAWQALLGRHGAGEDVVVGTPIAGRTRLETENLIGFFVNTLVIRTGLEGDPAFREVVGRVREGVLEAQAHQDVPFERLVDELAAERSLSHTPLFQVLFTLEQAARADDEGLRLGGTEIDAAASASGTAKFDLTLRMGDAGEQLVGSLEYRTELFDPSTAGRLVERLVRLLERAAADPDVRLSEIDLLDEAERRRVLEEWNAADAELPERTLHALFEAQAAATPAAPAVEFAGEALTYAGLDARAGRLARRLRGMGVGPDTVVALCVERSLELPAALLGVLKAGGAYLPLDPSYPPDRLRYMLEDSGARVLVTQRALRDRLDGVLAAAGGAVLCLDADEPGEADSFEADSFETDAPAPAAAPANLAYVIYTSGTTGRPKGVMVPHRAAARLVMAQAEKLGFGPGERVLQFAPLGFDTSVAEIFTALCTGSCLCVEAADALLPGPPLARLLAERRITNAKFTPSALAAVPAAELPELRTVIVGGEACPGELVARWAPGRRFFNVYGPTEATVRASCAECTPADPVPPIGRPLAGARLYVVDAGMRPVPAGVAGELFIGGEGVARGYLGRPALTAERFVPDPFGAGPGARLYRSGDRVRWRADGQLEFLGRIDEQVKVRGYRIEPGEVESVLLEHPAVREAVVAAREDVPGTKWLVAYVVGEGGAKPDPAALRAHLAERLPDYMVPGALVALEALPLTPNGKVDRRALPAPARGAARAGAYVAPRTAAEEVLAGIWSVVLGVERVGAEDNFFELGGHSLIATRVVSRVRGALGVELPLRAVFEAQTIRALAGRVEELQRGGAGVEAPPVVPVPRGGELPLSFAQQRLWFLDRLEPGSAVYNVPVALRLAGELDAAGLAWALTEVVRRHEVLRTTFGAGADGEPVQVVHAPVPVRLPVVDLSALDEAAREALAGRLAREEAARPFDLARGPVLRGTLLRVGAEESVLLFTMHHIASDAWSMEILQREVTALYGARVRGEDAHLPELPVQYADYAVWQRRWLEGEVLDRQLGYWKERLAGAPAVLELPTDRPRPAVADPRGGSASFTLPDEVSRALRELSRREGATLFMTLFAGVAALLSRYAGQPDVVVGTPIANRSRGETEDLIGFFLNTLALRIDLSGDPSVRELLGRVRETALGAYAHQEVPFERLVDELDVERSLGHTPLFQVLFT
ncbi:MAG TPA: amino acid adenylation domain-containing protein, partial [Longimicrobium sp.]